MKPGRLIYTLVCGITLLYVVVANARGFVPFTSSMGRGGSSSGYGGHSGTAGFFHK
jgi:hypothetical protein